MAPMIDQELEVVDKKHAALTAVNHQLNSALNLYHSLMKESFAMMSTPYYGGVPQTYAGIPQFSAIPSQPSNQMYSQANHVPNHVPNSVPVQHNATNASAIIKLSDAVPTDVLSNASAEQRNGWSDASVR